MGAIADLRSGRKTFKVGSPLDQWAVRELARKADPDLESAAASIDEVQSLADSTQTSGNMTLTFSIQQADKSFENFTTASIAFDEVSGAAEDAVHVIATDGTDHTGGTFTLTVTLFSGETFTTAAIDHDATAATVETAIDVAATAAAITSWTNTDISVSASGVDLQDGTLTLTFDGASVSGEPSHVLTVLTDSRTGGVSASPLISDTTVGIEADVNIAARAAGITGWVDGSIQVGGTAVDVGPLTFTFSGTGTGLNNALTVLADVDGAGGAWGAITQTTAGATDRPALSILLAYGVITGSVPEQDATASRTAFTKGTDTVNRIPAVLVKSLMREASAEDVNNSTYFSLEASLMRQDKAPLVEPRTTNDGLIHNG